MWKKQVTSHRIALKPKGRLNVRMGIELGFLARRKVVFAHVHIFAFTSHVYARSGSAKLIATHFDIRATRENKTSTKRSVDAVFVTCQVLRVPADDPHVSLFLALKQQQFVSVHFGLIAIANVDAVEKVALNGIVNDLDVVAAFGLVRWTAYDPVLGSTADHVALNEAIVDTIKLDAGRAPVVCPGADVQDVPAHRDFLPPLNDSTHATALNRIGFDDTVASPFSGDRIVPIAEHVVLGNGNGVRLSVGFRSYIDAIPWGSALGSGKRVLMDDYTLTTEDDDSIAVALRATLHSTYIQELIFLYVDVGIRCRRHVRKFDSADHQTL